MPKAKKSSRTPRLSFSFLKNVKINQVLYVLLLVSTFLLGYLLARVQLLEKGTGSVAGTQAAVPNAGTQPQGPAAKVNVKEGHLPALGKKDAKVTIVEFADFRCPFCEKFYTETEPQIIKDYVDTGKAKLVFRHFAFLGPASTVAANAAECANEQDKFWDFYNYLYKNQPPESDTSIYNTDSLSQAAETLGLDAASFRTCLDSNKYNDKVSQDLSEAKTAGVNATPTFFVNGRSLVGALPYENFKSVIEEELKK